MLSKSLLKQAMKPRVASRALASNKRYFSYNPRDKFADELVATAQGISTPGFGI